ncbi:MAG: GNAT family N-acetyltransferase [Firmicutes bacterium]|nr:GNAT family N-acetyltransferase [Bacillota bacterium]
MIRTAFLSELEEITKLARVVAKNIHSFGIDQWSDTYPNYQNFENDLKQNGLFVFVKENKVLASITILEENEAAYTCLSWHSNHAQVIHRLMVDPNFMRQGIASELMQFAIENAIKNHFDSIKIDTHPDNLRMQRFILANHFEKRGYIESINRIAYELLLI